MNKKTGAGLNLARILLKKKEYAVLFLDADITGTNALDFRNSPFWKDTCHAVQSITGDTPHDANLLDLFERRFMTGRFNIEMTSNRQQKDESLIIKLKKINIIGSEIYDLNGIPNTSDNTLICKPSILFDELHVFWFIEFLQQLSEAFIKTIRKDRGEDCPVAIIVDNSPGYVGIAPAVQEWLTDLGPDKGKFLIVSSPDIQDLSSCSHAINNLHRLYERKWETSRKFFKAIRREEDLDNKFRLNPEDKGFFLRLVEAYPRRNPPVILDRDIFSINGIDLSINGIDLPFYCKENDETGDAYQNQLEKYQGLVINRVPRFVKRGEYDFKMKRIYTLKNHMYTQMDPKVIERLRENFRRLLGEKRGSYLDCMVTYEESIEYQFLQSMISRKNEGRFEEFKNIVDTRYPIPTDIESQLMQQRGKVSSEKFLNGLMKDEIIYRRFIEKLKM
ncbi:MAG: hypothetical protein ACFFCW_43840 [Candidatus Hodarchaeota archaeon]